MIHSTEYPYILKEEGPRGDRAVIEGTSLAVWNVASDHYKGRLPVDKIVRKRELTSAQVHSALAYYHDHKAEVDQTERDDRLEDLCAKADRAGIGESFRVLVGAGKRHLWPQPSKYSILFAPLKDRRLALFTLSVCPAPDNRVGVWISPDLFPKFYPPITQEEVTALLGKETQSMSLSDAKAFAQGLDQLFDLVKTQAGAAEAK